jgi:hypothetical protein
MYPVCNVIMHALLVAAATAAGYSVTQLCLHPDPGIAFWSVVLPTLVAVMLRFVWPRKVVGHV